MFQNSAILNYFDAKTTFWITQEQSTLRKKKKRKDFEK